MANPTTNRNLRRVVKILKETSPKNKWFSPQELWEGSPIKDMLGLSTFKYYMTLIKRKSLWEGLNRDRTPGLGGSYEYIWECAVGKGSTDATQDVTAEYVTPQAASRFCTACGGNVSSESRFCQWCGVQMTRNEVVVSFKSSEYTVVVQNDSVDMDQIWSQVISNIGVADVKVKNDDDGKGFMITMGLKNQNG